MNYSQPVLKHPALPSAATVSLLLTLIPAQSSADTTSSGSVDGQIVRLEEIEVHSTHANAFTASLTESKADALQPQSLIKIDYFTNSVAPSADYATIAAVAPGVANVETNGPGLSEAKHTTIRGFDDGSYNVTFDGIPFGDYNTFTHHTTSYFPAKLLGQVLVDRGPGTASTIGNATFGGTMALYSKDPRSEATFIPTISRGSWNTNLYHFEVNTGRMEEFGKASAIASFQHMSSAGYRTNSDMSRDTYYVKYVQPVGHDTTITVLGSYNRIGFGNPGTITQQQIDLYGRNFGLKDNNAANALDVLNRRYNFQDKTADFEYLGLVTNLGDGWSINDKLYTYSYNNVSHEKPKLGSGSAAGKMLGSVKLNEYRTGGDTFSVEHSDVMGTFKAGLWYDATDNHRYTYGVNYDTTGSIQVDLTSTALYKTAAPGGNPLTLLGAPYYNYKYHLLDKNTSGQYFAEYEWKATSALSINGGVKYVSFTRDFNADVNQTSGRQALVAKRTDSDTLPSLSANYTITREWTAYAQVAQGFQSPSEGNSFYVDNANIGKINIKPELSTNYQVGTVFKHERFNADFDVYYIDFKNYAYNGPADASGDPTYYGIARGAYYTGAEAEATYFIGDGLSVYANGSVAQATFKGSKLDVPTVPKTTAVIGITYDKGGFFGSFTEKYVGSWFVYDTITNPDIAGAGASRVANSSSYWRGDLSVGYSQKLSHGIIRSFKVRFVVGNVFDQKVQVLDGIGSNPANAYASDTFNVLPTRNYFLTVSGEF